jgi:hypothetical protein
MGTDCDYQRLKGVGRRLEALAYSIGPDQAGYKSAFSSGAGFSDQLFSNADRGGLFSFSHERSRNHASFLLGPGVMRTKVVSPAIVRFRGRSC